MSRAMLGLVTFFACFIALSFLTILCLEPLVKLRDQWTLWRARRRAERAQEERSRLQSLRYRIESFHWDGGAQREIRARFDAWPTVNNGRDERDAAGRTLAEAQREFESIRTESQSLRDQMGQIIQETRDHYRRSSDGLWRIETREVTQYQREPAPPAVHEPEEDIKKKKPVKDPAPPAITEPDLPPVLDRRIRL